MASSSSSLVPGSFSSSFQRQLTVNLPVSASDDACCGGKKIKYTLRGLAGADAGNNQHESEIKCWAKFCASVFSYKSNPPPSSYFERHYYNDPNRIASYVRVATTFSKEDNDDDEIIVASCRIFVRSISSSSDGGCGDDGVIIKVGGIGEVCTAEQHRRRGLSKELLQDCITIMKEDGFKLSILHAAPQFFPVYQSVGYSCMTTKWTNISMNIDKLKQEVQTTTGVKPFLYKVRKASFPNDTKQLMRIYDHFSMKRFCGCIARSEQYWNQYLSKEYADENGNSLFVLVDCDNDKIDCYLSVRCFRDQNKVQVRDFGYYPEYRRHCRAYMWLKLLLHEAMHHSLFINTSDTAAAAAEAEKGTKTSSSCSSATSTSPTSSSSMYNLVIPTVVLEQIENSGICLEDDDDDYDGYDDVDSDYDDKNIIMSTAVEKELERSSFASYLDWDTRVEEDDHGWMYNVLKENEEEEEDDISMLLPGLQLVEREDDGNGNDGNTNSQQPKRKTPPVQHLIWPVDSF